MSIGRGADEFVERVRQWLENPPNPDEKRGISGSMAGETWEAKVREIVGLIERNIAEGLRQARNKGSS